MTEKEQKTTDNLLQESFANIVKKSDGLNTLYFILLNLGYFTPIFSTDKNIYKYAALADAARFIENQIDEADPQAMQKIKYIHKNYVEEN